MSSEIPSRVDQASLVAVGGDSRSLKVYSIIWLARFDTPGSGMLGNSHLLIQIRQHLRQGKRQQFGFRLGYSFHRLLS